MKIIFTFSDSSDLKALPHEHIYRSYFALPDTVLQLPDAKSRILTIATLVSQLTDAILHCTCAELGLMDLPLKLARGDAHRSVIESYTYLAIRFVCHHHRLVHRDLKVFLPIPSQLFLGSERNSFLPASFVGHNVPKTEYVSRVTQIAEQCLLLLNSEPPLPNRTAWQYWGFAPVFEDGSLIARSNNRMKKERAEERKRLRREEKRSQREANAQEDGVPPTTGAGRRIGAVPGVFMGVQFRSQLEIRFVTQLEAQHIRWIYEGERLGEGKYLVDFYLPDLKVWVEVKGQLAARDNFFLKEVASYLKQARNERLFIYTSSKAFVVSSRSFTELTHNRFWTKIFD